MSSRHPLMRDNLHAVVLWPVESAWTSILFKDEKSVAGDVVASPGTPYRLASYDTVT